MRPPIYLDYNATTPLDPAVREAMAPFLGDRFGNPSSVHSHGRLARAAVDAAREDLASLLGCRPSEVSFTSGGTESCNWALLGTARQLAGARRHLVVSAIEHPAVLEPARHLAAAEGFQLTIVPVGPSGVVEPAAVRAAVRADTALVSVMAANNEIGTVQPVAEIAAVCRAAGVLFHTDASQWFGKLPISTAWQFGADLVTLCAHKFHGPKGAGALIHRSGAAPLPLLFGGPQQDERRPGTENVAAIVGLVEAAKRHVVSPLASASVLTPLASRLHSALGDLPGVRVWSPRFGGLPNTVAVSVADSDSLSLLAGLDLLGISVSSGSACSAGSLKPSHVLLALGASPAEASALVRFSIGAQTTLAEIEVAINAFETVVNQLRRV